MAAVCPVAGTPGLRVRAATLRSLVREGRLPEVEGGEWFCCDVPDCDIVYFAADGRTLGKDALTVRVGAKERVAPRLVCYCFGHSVESIREEIVRTGQSTVAASIAARVKAGECRCATMNPKGICCLADIHKAVREVFLVVGAEQPASAPTDVASDLRGHDCCAPLAGPRSRAGRVCRTRGSVERGA